MNLQSLKRACARVLAGSKKGSAYLVGPDVLATCEHVIAEVGPGGPVTVHFDGEDAPLAATVIQVDEEGDAALLSLAAPANRAPLPIADRCAEKDEWHTYGYPGVAGSDGAPFDGVIMDPDGRKGRRPALVLFSEQLAAGMATPVHGLSGSPILVAGCVVGHVREVRSDPSNPGRPAWGYIYGSPSAAVIKLLGPKTGAVVQVVAPPAPKPFSGEYDVFISYRATDRRFALALLTELESRGLRVFLDQKELLPGDRLANRVQEALGKSRAAVVLVSQGWLASPWCQEEGNALLHRSIEDPSFRVVPLRLDGCEMPPMWNGRLWLDFAAPASVTGSALERLVLALGVGASQAHERANVKTGETQRREIEEAQAEARAAKVALQAARQGKSPISVEQAEQQLRAATRTSARRVLELWRRTVDDGLPAIRISLLAAESLVALGDPASALTVIEHAGGALRARQLKALALAKCERRDEAIEILEVLREEGHIDAETAGILGGRLKDKWLKTKNERFLERSYAVYRDAWERSGDTYPGINVAALALALGRRAESTEVANKVLQTLGRDPEAGSDQYKLATHAEALLLLGIIDGDQGARHFYSEAVALYPNRDQDIAVMRRQARRNLGYLGRAPDALDDILPVPAVLAFTGHLTDSPGRPQQRFPESLVFEVRNAIRRYLAEHKVKYGYSSAARGADLLFVEEMLDCDGSVHVFLPFPAEGFKATSVGESWRARFDAALAKVGAQLTVLAGQVPAEAEQAAAYSACNLAIREAARARAELLDQKPRLLAVWNRQLGDGSGGTADTVREWQQAGFEVDIIDVGEMLRGK